MILFVAYWGIAAVVLVVAWTVAWRTAVARGEGVDDLAAYLFMGVGAGMLWPLLPVGYVLRLALERAQRRREAADR